MFVRYLKLKTKHLFPAYFAMVMTSGVLSISAYFLDMIAFAYLLLWINAATYLVLCTFTISRLYFYFPQLLTDLTSHQKGAGFFTIIAGTSVLGSQIYILTGHFVFPFVLWIIAILLWLLIMYSFFTSITIQQNKPSLSEGINGSWLIAAVSTQSVSVLGTLISADITRGKEIVLFFTLSMFLLGCMLYLNIILLIFYRFTFLRLTAETFSPPYWINMGAVAITTLAGATLILHADQFALLKEILPFLKGFTLFFWVTGTWWIPLLLILMVWRHVVHRFPLTYDPQFWGMSFPFAMYTASTWQLAQALDFPFIAKISHISIYAAIIVYLFVFAGFCHHVYQDLRKVS